MTSRIAPRRPLEVAAFAGVVEHLTKFCFDSKAVGVMAVGAIRDDFRRKRSDTIKDLSALLGTVKTQGIRNAIRLALRDLYKAAEDEENALAQLKALVAENDQAIQAEKK